MDEVMSRTTRRARAWRIVGAVTSLAVTALAVGLTQLRSRPDEPAAAPAPAVTPSAVGASPVVLNATDNAFIQLLIPMNEGALALFDYLDTRPAETDPPLRAAVERIRAAHRSEVRELRALLAAAHMPEENIHEGHQMPGMVTDARLTELRAAPAVELRSGTVALIRAHLEQTVVLCRGEQANGASPELKAVVARMQEARTAELDELARLPDPVAAGAGG
ncbi:protein of unknown function [Micromonospora krabiensis]|uniref:DUF305 domain-containing protein n=2 Tax=Micromonospora krabiensis TaxID=307121 RepID=A0A1C3N149_9ACTN|nr:protein of unknown function [Micromonospora krabiensis]